MDLYMHEDLGSDKVRIFDLGPHWIDNAYAGRGLKYAMA
jgi:hypothetical protein